MLVGSIGVVPASLRYPKAVGISDDCVRLKTILGVKRRSWPEIMVVGDWKGRPPGMIALRITRKMSQMGMGKGVSVVSTEQAEAIKCHRYYAPGRQEVPEKFLVNMSRYDESTLKDLIKNRDALEQVLEYKRKSHGGGKEPTQ